MQRKKLCQTFLLSFCRRRFAFYLANQRNRLKILCRADMKLAENQLELLTAVAAANPNVVVLLSAGSSLESAWVKDCKALVYGCLGGQAGAGALVEVLTGAQNPCGKLAETWARSYADTPAKAHFGGDGPTVEYREGLYVGYRYYDTAGVPTAFPFGYGLSYTSFAYSDLKACENQCRVRTWFIRL